MKTKTSTALCGLTLGLFAVVAATTTSSGAVTLFSGTGQDIQTDANSSFPTRTPSLNGTSLVFNDGTSGADFLIKMKLFSAGTFSGATGPIEFTIDMNLTRLGGTSGNPIDFDPGIGISDGSRYVGTRVNDGNPGFGTELNPSSAAYEFTHNGTNLSSQINVVGLFTGATYPAINGAFDLQTTITLESSLSNVADAWGGKSGNGDVGALDRTGQLDFIFAAGDFYEHYQVNTLTITTNIPEPSRALLSLVGIAAIGLRRRRS